MSPYRFLKSVALVSLLILGQSAAFGQSQPISAIASSSPAAVVGWNSIAQRTAITVAKQFQTQSMIYIAFAQAAVYDAVVAIQGRYQPYVLVAERKPGASVDAAVATAAHAVLVHYFGAQQPALDTDYANALAAIPDGTAKSDGVSVGQAAANALITLRQGDGLEAEIGFTLPSASPGAWQLAGGVTPQTPWVSKLRPFLLLNADQFRPSPPPGLATVEWAAEFNEVKEFGRSNSLVRTAEQSDVARFWSTNAVVQYNAAFGQIVSDRALDAVEAARLFAMGNLVGVDALIACFDAKYHYVFWRPQFAIPMADSDANPATIGDPTWTPLLATPNHPEYPAAHGCLTGAEGEVFATFLGTNYIDVDLKSTVPNLLRPSRHYDRVVDLVQEIIDARVWGGLHYRESGIKGVNVGRKVAHWTLQRFFLRVN